MKSRRLLGIAALGAAAASLVMVPGAHAQEATFSASSTGRALALNVGPEGITLGQTTSTVNSEVLAAAEAVGIASPLSAAGESDAEVKGDNGSAGSPEETCSGELPAIPLLAGSLACSSSVAKVVDGVPTSTASARVGQLVADPISPLLGTPLSAVVEGLDNGVDQLLDGLSPITGPIDEGTNLGLDDTLNTLFDELFAGAPLLTLTLGAHESASTLTPDGNVVSTCTANGARIDLLDPPPVEATDNLPAVDAPPVLSLIIGEASTTMTANTLTGAAEGSSNPSIVTIKIPTSPALDNTQVGPGQTVEIPLPDPFGTQVISVAGPETGVTDDGQQFARASAVRIHLLPTDTFQGGLELALGDCFSVGGATVAAPPTTTTTQPPLLPRTGADGPNPIALASTIGFAGLGIALLRRTRTV